MKTGPSTTDAPIKATMRSLEIVEELMRRDGAGVTELADALGYSKSTIHDHLTTLRAANYVRREDDRYRVGLYFLTLGGHARRHEELFEYGKGEVDDLVAETGEAAKIAVEENGRGVYLYKSRGE
ncbi:MAG: helix-turn-helix domain-containing protein, partial [Halanaeroarchaeum sp.]